MALRLDRLQRGDRIADSDGIISLFFQSLWQRVMETIERADTTQQEQIDAIAAANAAAAAANAAAVIAQGAADDAASVSQLTTSGVSGLTITATDAGADVTITISAHTRVYGDGTSVAVSGGTLLGRPYSTVLYLYYDDPTRAGGAVTYQSTTSQATGAQTGDRHSLGAVTTPAAAAGPVTGSPNLPPGVVEP